MYYSLKQLKENLTEKILGLGIKQEFLENPAFSSALSEFGQMLYNMEDSYSSVKEENGVISITCTTPYEVKYSMKIWSPNAETFKCVRVMEEKPYIGPSGQYIRTKHATEVTVGINEYNFINVIQNGSSINNIDCKDGVTNNSTYARKKEYNADGVMITKEEKVYEVGPLNKSIDMANADDMLFIPRQAFQIGMFMENKYLHRNLLRRVTLDVARELVEDKGKGTRYSSCTQLHGEHGYRDMVSLRGWGGSNPYPKDVIINPISKEEVERLIQLEHHPKVQEGLRKYAKDREKFYYNSSEDQYFEYQGIEQKENNHVK